MFPLLYVDAWGSSPCGPWVGRKCIFSVHFFGTQSAASAISFCNRSISLCGHAQNKNGDPLYRTLTVKCRVCIHRIQFFRSRGRPAPSCFYSGGSWWMLFPFHTPRRLSHLCLSACKHHFLGRGLSSCKPGSTHFGCCTCNPQHTLYRKKTEAVGRNECT